MTSIQPYQPRQHDVVAGLEKIINHKDELSPAEQKAALSSVLHESIAEHRVHQTAVDTDALFCDMVAFAESVKTEFNGSLSVNQKEAFNDLLGQYTAMKTIMFPAAAKDLAARRAESDA